MDLYLSRADTRIPLDQLVSNVARDFSLGTVRSWEPIRQGYQELNLKTTTDKGVFVIKIFSNRFAKKSLDNINDNVKVLLAFQKADIPAVTLVKGKDGYVFSTPGKQGTTYGLVMKFFDGESLATLKPTRQDTDTITQYLAKIHSLPITVNRYYDTWGTAHLLKEWEKNQHQLTSEDKKEIQPLLERYETTPWNKLRTCVIHGDLQRQHVLKSKSGKYCILDLGCMDYNAAALDLGIFIALFCIDLDSPKKEIQKMVEHVIEQYNQEHSLTKKERELIPLFVRTTYGMYVIGSNYERVARSDSTQQTKYWIAFGRKGLKKVTLDLLS